MESSPLGLARRVIRSGLRQLGSELRDVSFEHIEAVRRLLEPGKSGKFVEIPGGLEAAREFDRLVFRRVAKARPDYEYELQIPGHVHIPELGKIFRAEIIEDKRNLPNAGCVFVDAGSIGPCVRIRNWKPGDYYRPVGLPAGKLKKLFRRARIPRIERPPVHHDLVVEAQHRRQPLPLVLDEVVAALAQRVPEQDGALREVDRVLRAASRHFPREHRIRRQPGGLGHALAEVCERQSRAGLQHLHDLRGHVVALGKLSCRIAHGVLLPFGHAGLRDAGAHGSGADDADRLHAAYVSARPLAESSAKRLHSVGIRCAHLWIIALWR